MLGKTRKMIIKEVSSFYHLLLLLLISCSYFQYNYCEGCHEEERRALSHIIDSINPVKDIQLSVWVGKDCCKWDWIKCNNSSSRVVYLDLSLIRNIWSSNDSGLWYPNVTLFSSFKMLRWLDLSFNNIAENGTKLLQVVCQLSLLEDLSVTSNSLKGVVPPCLGNLTSLTFLDLSRNQFQGNIMRLFGQNHPIRMRDASNFSNSTISPPWKKLQILDLGSNELTGDGLDLAQVVCQLSFLEGLWVNHNSLEGVVPQCLGNLASLSILDLSENNFTGNIPAMDKMNALERLNLSNNGFEGDILHLFGQNHVVRDMSSPYDNMSSPLMKLEVLDLSNNALTGDGWDIFQAICQTETLSVLFLDHNSLKGRLHPCLGMMEFMLFLGLSYNQFQGSVPPFSDGLLYLDLSYNRLEGDILARDSNTSELEFLWLQNNRFTRLTTLPRLLILVDLRHNHLSGDIYSALLPLPHLRALLFGGNHLEGNIPKQLCKMELLQFIDLSDNNLTGKIPSCLNNISSMRDKYQLLHEGSMIIERGNFPADFRHHTITADFTTKGNSYTYVGDPLTFMTGIDLSCNQLTGGIPSEIGDLRNLHALNLSNNHLAGSLPISFQNMENMESLDISCNELSGALPLQLTRLHLLSIFNVSFNNLSGSIPFNQQFSTFKSDSFMGNMGLCGPPVEIKCSTKTTLGHNTPRPNFDDEDGAASLIENRLFFYAWVAISYALGFSGFFGLLMLSKKWRHKYFTTIDEYIYTS